MALPQRKSQDNSGSITPGPYQYQVRNAQREEYKKKKLNNDFEYLNESETLPTNASNDQLFNERYKENGLRSKEISNNKQRDQKPAQESPTQNQPATEKKQSLASRLKAAKAKKASLNKTKTLAKRALVKTRVSVVNATIMAWGGNLWLAQAAFALLSIVFLGAVAGVASVVESSTILSVIGGAINSVIETATSLLGFEVGLGSAGAAMFLVCYMIAMAIGIITLLVAYIQYMAAFLHPLSGKGAGMKYGALLLAIIGYCTPILNIFPWFLVCLAVVWKYPK